MVSAAPGAAFFTVARTCSNICCVSFWKTGNIVRLLDMGLFMTFALRLIQFKFRIFLEDLRQVFDITRKRNANRRCYKG